MITFEARLEAINKVKRKRENEVLISLQFMHDEFG